MTFHEKDITINFREFIYTISQPLSKLHRRAITYAILSPSFLAINRFIWNLCCLFSCFLFGIHE